MASNNKKTEVTKLLTVTLDKIHESKRARFGPNLRKNLLVQSVLHKAKDIYVTEVKNRAKTTDHITNRVTEDPQQMDTTTPVSTTTTSSNPSNNSAMMSTGTNISDAMNGSGKTTESCAQPSKLKRKFTTQSSMIEGESECKVRYLDYSSSADEEDEDSESDDQSDSEIITSVPFSRFASKPLSSSESLVDDILDELATDSENESSTLTANAIDKENNPPAIIASKTLNTECGRCLKRRASVQFDYYDSSESFDSKPKDDSFSDIYGYVPNKISRSTSVSVDSQSHVVMDTTAPINSLVKIFSQSFLELTDINNDTSHYERSTEFNTFALCRESITLTA